NRDGIAGAATGKVQLRGVDELGLRSTLTLQFNNSGQAVDRVIGSTELKFEDSADFLRVTGDGDLKVAEFLDLTGAFMIRRITGASPGETEIEVGVSGIEGGTSFEFAGLIYGNGTFALSGNVVVTEQALLNQIVLGGAFALRVNTTGRELNREVKVGATTVSLAFGPNETRVVRFSGTNVVLSTPVGDLAGTMVFSKDLTTGRVIAAGDGISVRVGTEDVGVAIENGGFAMVVEAAGTYAFQVTGSARIDGVTGLEFSGDFFAETNTTGADLTLSGIDPDGPGTGLAARALHVPAGVTRFGADDAVLDVGAGAFVLSGAFVVERSTTGPDALAGTPDDAEEIVVGATGVELFVGDGTGQPGD